VRKWGGTVGQSTWLVALACAAASLVAGCGSSESKSTTSASTSTSATPKSGLTTDGKINYAKPAANAPVQSGLIEISYHEITIEPDTVKAKVGSTVKWTNNDPEKCNVTSEGGPYKFASKDFGEGGSFELKLEKPGVIHYECTYYPTTMNGTIEVLS
jgi:plastocyanin